MEIKSEGNVRAGGISNTMISNLGSLQASIILSWDILEGITLCTPQDSCEEQIRKGCENALKAAMHYVM